MGYLFRHLEMVSLGCAVFFAVFAAGAAASEKRRERRLRHKDFR